MIFTDERLGAPPPHHHHHGGGRRRAPTVIYANAPTETAFVDSSMDNYSIAQLIDMVRALQAENAVLRGKR